YFKRSSQSRQGTVSESSFAHGTNISSSRGTAKHPRSGSLSQSPDQRTRASHWSAPRRTPPIPRGRLNPIGGSKYSGPAYQHLQEVDSSEREAEAQRGCQTQGDPRCVDPRRDAFLHMQTPPVTFETSSPSSLSVEVRSGAIDLNSSTRSLRKPGRRNSQSPPAPFRSCSIPIIPSVQYHHDNEASCMQTSVSSATRSMSSGGGKEARREKTAAHVVALSSTSCSSAIGQQRDEVALLLEEAQEQLRKLALANRKQEVEARETVCFLNLNGGSVGALSCNGPTQTQLLTPSLSHRDLGQISQ
ncbi:Pro-neuregulin-3 membrane-bound isoform, partial [Dissostichus eleginoides]